MADEKKEDRRVRKTKSQLRAALNTLIGQKSINEISVKELTTLADVNRGTFYLHYKDIPDMIKKIEEEMFSGLVAELDKKSADEDAMPLSILVDFFSFLSQNNQMCITLLGAHGDIAFYNRLKEFIKDKCLNNWMSYYSNTNTVIFEYYYSFIASGCSSLFKKWLDGGMKETPEQMATMAGQMIMYGAKVLY